MIVAGDAPSPDNWQTVTYDLTPHRGREVLLAVKFAAGGRWAYNNEEAFLDAFIVK